MHAFVVLGNAKFATFSGLITWFVLTMAALNESILFPKTVGFVVPSNFVFQASMLHLEFEDVVQVEVRWLELYLA